MYTNICVCVYVYTYITGARRVGGRSGGGMSGGRGGGRWPFVMSGWG